jgi:predicted dehydrogenase
MNKNLNIGIIGFGGSGMAQFQHFSDIEGSKVISVFDPNDGGLDRARQMSPLLLATKNFSEFMDSGINAIAVCSPDKTHADYVVAALNAGKHVVCEKPLTDTLDGCKAILDAEANSRGVVAAVQHQMRFLPVHLEMKQLITSGKLGKISYIEGYYVHNLTRRAYLYDDWRRTDNATPLVYSGCHFVDLLRWLLNDEVEEIMGMANNLAFPEYPESDLNVLLLRFRSGIIGKIVIAFGAGRPQDHSVRVYGSERSIENNILFSKNGSHEVFSKPHLPRDEFPKQKAAHLAWYMRGPNHYRSSFRRHRIYWLGKMFELLMRRKGYDHEYGISSYPIRLYPHGLAVRSSLENFVAAIRGEKALECSLKDAARTVATCLAGVEAYRTEKKVRVSDFWIPELD